MERYDIFVSYSVKDSDIADRMVECIEKHGLRCWIAPRNIMHGGMWAEEIVEAISRTKGLVLIYSKNSHASSQVPKEVGLATSNKKRIFPFCIDDTPLDGAFLYHLSDCQLIQAQTNRAQRMEELAQVLQELFYTENDAGTEQTDPAKNTERPDSYRREGDPGMPSRKKILILGIAATVVVIIGLEAWFVSSRNKDAKRTGGITQVSNTSGSADGGNPAAGSINDDNTSVTVTGRQITQEDLDGYLQMTSLETLTLEAVGLDNEMIKCLAGMSNLKTLSIVDNPQVTDIVPLAGLTNLRTLDISGTGVSDLECLKDFASVRELKMDQLMAVSENTIALPPGISELECSDSGIENIDFLKTADASRLTDLDLSGNRISDISVLAELYAVRQLDISDNRISDISPLKNSFAISTLDISGNQVTDLSVTAGMESLTNINITNNQIEDISPLADNASFAAKVKRLDLFGNRISDISAVMRFPELKSLDLYDNQVTDISVLKNCTNLQRLDLSDNQVVDLSPLSEISTLHSLYILHNPVTKVDGTMIRGRSKMGMDKGYLFVSYQDGIDWEALLTINDLVVRVYDAPEKEQYRLEQELSVKIAGTEFRDYESYLHDRGSE